MKIPHVNRNVYFLKYFHLNIEIKIERNQTNEKNGESIS